MKQRIPEPILKFFSAAWAPVLLTLVTIATFFTTLFLNRRSFYIFPDNVDQAYAWYQKLTYVVHQGALPLWDANVNAGHSFVGDLITGTFYPINILWVWLFGSSSGISLWSLEALVVFHFWLAGLGMYLAARSLGLGKWASLASGMVFAVGGTVAMRSVSQTVIFFGLCLIPWVFYAFMVWLKNKRWWALALCGVLLGMIILSGHIQPWFHAAMLIGLFVLLRNPHPGFEPWLKSIGKRLVGVAVAVVLSLAVALPQVVMAAVYLPQAVRLVGDAQPIKPNDKISFTTFTRTYSFKLPDFFSLVDPTTYRVTDGNELYVGLTGITLVGGMFILFRRTLKEHPTWRLYSWFLIGTIAIAAIIMIGSLTFIPLIMREIPVVSQIRQLARYSILVHFCLAVLVGIAVEVWIKSAPSLKANKKKWLIVLATTAFLGINSAYFLALAYFGRLDKHFAIQSAIMAAALAGWLLFAKWGKQILLGAIILATVAQPLWFMPPLASNKSMYPPDYYRRTPAITYLEQFYGKARVLIEESALPPNIGDVYNIQTLNGYGATLHDHFYAYLNADGRVGEHMNYMNIRFIVSKKDKQQPAKYNYKPVLTDEERGIIVYERPTYAPRAYLLSQKDDCINQLASCNKPEINQYSDTLITVNYNATTADKLVLSEIAFTGWNAYVDGKKVNVEAFGPTDIKLFRMVAVPAGQHTVEFRYQPIGL